MTFEHYRDFVGQVEDSNFCFNTRNDLIEHLWLSKANVHSDGYKSMNKFYLAIQVAINVLLTIFLLDPSNFRTNLLYTIANMFPLNQKMIISKHRCKLWSLMMTWTELECAGAYIW